MQQAVLPSVSPDGTLSKRDLFLLQRVVEQLTCALSVERLGAATAVAAGGSLPLSRLFLEWELGRESKE